MRAIDLSQIILVNSRTRRPPRWCHPEELFAHDQDHPGRLAVNDIWPRVPRSRRASILRRPRRPGALTSRTNGADVTGIERPPALPAPTLTRLVVLQG
jgi:hypothetical protein